MTAFALLPFFFLGCSGPTATTLSPRRAVVVTFVDLTGSIDDITAADVQKKVENLFNNLSEGSIFYLFPVDFGTNIDPIFTYQKSDCDIKRESDKKKCEDLFAAEKSKALDKLTQSLADYKARMTSPEIKKLDNSCLISKLITAQSLFRSKYPDSNAYQLNLFFFSDMIEDCSESFDRKPVSFDGKASFEAIKSRLEPDAKLPDQADFKNLSVKLFVIHTIRKDSLPFYQLRELWNIVFNKFGFEKDQALNCYWTSQLPDKDFAK